MAIDEGSSESGNEEPWIQWFCRQKGHNIFCEIERSYIEDGFNLYGLRAYISNFSDSLDLILDLVSPNTSDKSHLLQSACTLYQLIHARYIVTTNGLDAMYNKYASKDFGICPLLQCEGQPVLPIGTTDEIGVDTVKNFCPCCQRIYNPFNKRSRNNKDFTVKNMGFGLIDGAAFGTTFPHLFLMTFRNLTPNKLSSRSVYIPRVYGFRIHTSPQSKLNTLISTFFENIPTSSRKNERKGLSEITSHTEPVNQLLRNKENKEERITRNDLLRTKIQINDNKFENDTTRNAKCIKLFEHHENKEAIKVTSKLNHKSFDVKENMSPIKAKKQKRSDI